MSVLEGIALAVLGLMLVGTVSACILAFLFEFWDWERERKKK